MTHGLNEAIQGIYILLSIAVLATYWSARGIFRHSTRHVVVTELLAILVAITAADFFQTGMEIILTVPLALFLLFRLLKVSTSPTPMAVGAYALLASMIILARLDAVFLAFLLAVFLAFDPSLRRSMTGQHALALLAGLSPIVLYVGINLACFHTIIPVSGQAKQLRFTHHPSEIVLT